MTLSTRFSPHRTHKRDGYPSLSVTPKSWMSSMVAGALISQMPPKGGLSLMWALPVKITPRTRGMHMPKESRASRKISELGHALCSAASQDRILTLTDPRRGTTRTGGSPAKNAAAHATTTACFPSPCRPTNAGPTATRDRPQSSDWERAQQRTIPIGRRITPQVSGA